MLRSPHRALEEIALSTGLPAGNPSVHDASSRLTAVMPLPRTKSTTSQAPRFVPKYDERISVPAPRRWRLSDPVEPRTRTVKHVSSLPSQKRFPVASLDLSRGDIALPYGIGRYVSVSTLKAIAGGGRFDRLLKKTPAGWAFVEDAEQIDLTNNRQEFRLGRLTIFS